MTNYRQKGFTLIELLVTLAIVGVVGTGIAGVLGQASSGNAMTTNRQVAVNHIQNAIDMISTDAQMAQQVLVEDSAGNQKAVDAVTKTVSFDLQASEKVILKWSDWDAARYTSTFALDADGTLIRTNTVKLAGQSPLPNTQTLAAKYISAITGVWNTNLKILTINIVATAGDYKSASESRTFQIIPRPAQ